jgi:hypothetical protein
MKYKTTKKELNNNYHEIIGIGYCEAQNLLQYQNTCSYCTGVYGWSCDNYDIGGILISTGYSYINSKNVKNYDYELLNKYELLAEKIPYNEVFRKDKVNELLNSFILECIK